MDGRHYHNSLRRLRLFAGEAELTPEKVVKIMQPFIDEWRPPKVPNRRGTSASMDPELTLSAPSLTDLAARIRAIGMNLNKAGLKGIHYHNAFQRHLAALASNFDCQGWTESAALFDDPDQAGEAPQLAGRVDVLWTRRQEAVVIIEIDSGAKAKSFQKLKDAAAPHRLWVYFGGDLWGFRMFLQKNDPAREITPVIVPQTFIPSFDDQPG